MTIIEAINAIDSVKPNTYKHHEKVKWLSMLDGIIYNKIIATHEGATLESFKEYDADDTTTVLLVPHPYDDIYLRWLEARIDFANGETDRYNNSLEAYNDIYSEYERYYNRTHLPIGAKFKYF